MIGVTVDISNGRIVPVCPASVDGLGSYAPAEPYPAVEIELEAGQLLVVAGIGALLATEDCRLSITVLPPRQRVPAASTEGEA